MFGMAQTLVPNAESQNFQELAENIHHCKVQVKFTGARVCMSMWLCKFVCVCICICACAHACVCVCVFMSAMCHRRHYELPTCQTSATVVTLSRSYVRSLYLSSFSAFHVREVRNCRHFEPPLCQKCVTVIISNPRVSEVYDCRHSTFLMRGGLWPNPKMVKIVFFVFVLLRFRRGGESREIAEVFLLGGLMSKVCTHCQFEAFKYQKSTTVVSFSTCQEWNWRHFEPFIFLSEVCTCRHSEPSRLSCSEYCRGWCALQFREPELTGAGKKSCIAWSISSSPAEAAVDQTSHDEKGGGIARFTSSSPADATVDQISQNEAGVEVGIAWITDEPGEHLRHNNLTYGLRPTTYDLLPTTSSSSYYH